MGDRGNYRHRMGLGRTLLKMRLLAHAVRMFEEASSLLPRTDPAAYEAHFWLGMVKSKQGLLREASVHYKNALASAPRHLDRYALCCC